MTLRIAGSVHAMPPGESCVSSASNMLGMMIGVNSGSTKVDELLNTKTIVLWGANVCDLYPPYSRWLEMAREKGVKIVYLDPRRTRTSLLADMQLRPLPGTDGVLAIGAIRYMLETGAYDEERARFQIEGFDELAAETESFTVEKVASATGLSRKRSRPFTGRWPRARAPWSGSAARCPATPTGSSACGPSSCCRRCATTSSGKGRAFSPSRAASPKGTTSSSIISSARPKRRR